MDIIRKALIISLVSIAGTGYAFAAPVTPEEACAVAQSFVRRCALKSKQGIKGVVSMRPVYTAETNAGNAYYIFSDSNADIFTIVSADTRLPQILGYSMNSTFDAAEIPCNLHWWLESMTSEIAYFLQSDPPEPTQTRAIETETPYRPVEPLLTTKWNQDGPFNIMCPLVGGVRCPTGCAATAMAQVMKYHNYPEKGTGQRNDYDFEHEFYWDRMIDDYRNEQYVSQNARAVADLMLACGKSMDMLYTPSASGANTHIQQHSLTAYFGYDKDVRIIERDYFSLADWTKLIYGELEAGRPVIYGGIAPAGGHEFVCDGYSGDGLFHINWGWGGLSDGYFRLSALTPSDNGIGGYAGGYNSQQFAFINVQPDDGDGELQRYLITNGPFYYKDGIFTVRSSQMGQSGIFYNPLEEGFYAEVGLKICDYNGRFVCYVADPEGADLEVMSGFEGFTVEMPELPDGKYKLFPVYRADGSEWMPVSIPYGQQDYVALTVKDGSPEYINEWRSDIYNSALVFSDIIVSDDASSGVPVSFTFYVHNVGKGAFTDTLFVIVTDTEGNRLAEIEAPANVQSMRSALVSVAATSALPEGICFASIEDKDYNVLSEPIEFVVGSASSDTGTIDPVLEIKKPFNVSGTLSDVQIRVVKRDNAERRLVVRVLSADCSRIVTSSAENPYMLAANASGRYDISQLDLNLAPGFYRFDITDDAGNVLTRPYPLTVRGGLTENSEIAVETVSDRETQLAPPTQGEYVGQVVIPAETGGSTVSAIRPDALALAGRVTGITLPHTLKHIGKSDFYAMDALKKITVEAEMPFAISEDCMPGNRFEEIILKVPAESANVYKRMPVWCLFDVPGWEISVPSDISVIDGLTRDENGEIYSPYYVEADKTLSFTLQLPQGKAFRVSLRRPNGARTVMASMDGNITLPAIESGIGKAVIEVVSPDGIESVNASEISDVYDVNGNLIMRNADVNSLHHLYPGIYVFCGRLIMVK